jgi:hypothetical protein
MDLLPPNRRCQRPWPRIATGVAPGASSAAAMLRPSAGPTPSVEKKLAEMASASSRSGSPPPVRLRFSLRKAAISSNVRACTRQSTKFGYETGSSCPAAVRSPRIISRSGS